MTASVPGAVPVAGTRGAPHDGTPDAATPLPPPSSVPPTTHGLASFAVARGAFDGVDGAGVLDLLMNAIDEGVCVGDSTYRFLGANATMARFYGLSDPALLIGQRVDDVFPGWRHSVFFAACEAAVREHTPQFVMGYSEVLCDWISVRFFPVGHDRFAFLAHRIVGGGDASAAARQYDDLTALPNRWHLDNDLSCLSATSQSGALAVIDVQRFRDLSQSFDRSTVDRILVEVAGRIQNRLIAPQRPYRYCNEQFAVWSPTGEEALMRSIRRIRFALQQPFLVAGRPLSLQFRIGSCPRLPDDDASATCARAETALEEARRRRDVHVTWHHDMTSARERVLLGADLGRALASGGEEFIIHLQPIVDGLDGRTIHAEALIRWQHPERGLLLPDAFLPTAEEHGLIGDLDRIAMQRAAAAVLLCARNGVPLSIAVNLSSDSVCDPSTPDWIQRLLQDTGLSHTQLWCEITESSLIRHVDLSRTVVDRLRNMGIAVVIDDFGSGQAGFHYVVSYPARALKIDRTLITPLISSETHRVMVHNIIRMAHGLGSLLVAEGVETAEHAALLRGMGCDLLQGWHCGRPMAVDVFPAWVAAHGGSGSLASPVQ